MEYSKEDLMEAKKQILGVGENMGTEESKKIWEENAQFWDNAMGDESNEFHREVVRPKVTELLSPNPADYILDIACGNGNYSSYLAQRGASVVAFDYSKNLSIIKAFSICPIPTCISARDDDAGERPSRHFDRSEAEWRNLTPQWAKKGRG